MIKKKKIKKDSEEICEVFDIGKKEKEKEKKVCGAIEKKHLTKEEIKKQNKILRNILIGFGIIVLLVLRDSIANLVFSFTPNNSLLLIKKTDSSIG